MANTSGPFGPLPGKCGKTSQRIEGSHSEYPIWRDSFTLGGNSLFALPLRVLLRVLLLRGLLLRGLLLRVLLLVPLLDYLRFLLLDYLKVLLFKPSTSTFWWE